MFFSKQRRKLSMVLFTVIALVGTFSLAVAQDENTRYDDVDMITGVDPVAADVSDMAEDATLEGVTSNSPDYYGSVVTFEGNISEFVNSYTFVLGEDATLDNDQVLVINNASHPFNPDVMKGARVQITGRVLPSVEAVNDGATTEYDSMFHDDEMMTDEDTSEEAMTDDEMNNMAMGRYNVVQFAQNGHLTEAYDAFTIVEIVNRDNVTIIEQVEG